MPSQHHIDLQLDLRHILGSQSSDYLEAKRQPVTLTQSLDQLPAPLS
jgi:hypothetical protein